MKTLSACRGLIGIADDGLRRVMRELLLGVKMHEFEFLADVGGARLCHPGKSSGFRPDHNPK